MDACGYVSAVATPEILEAKIDTTLSYFADLSYFFGPAADSIQIDKVQYPDRTVVERCAMIRDSGDKTELVLEMWSRVKGIIWGRRGYCDSGICRDYGSIHRV